MNSAKLAPFWKSANARRLSSQFGKSGSSAKVELNACHNHQQSPSGQESSQSCRVGNCSVPARSFDLGIVGQSTLSLEFLLWLTRLNDRLPTLSTTVIYFNFNVTEQK